MQMLRTARILMMIFLRQLFCDTWLQKTLAAQYKDINTKRVAAGTWSPHRTIRFDTDRYPVIGEVHVTVPGNFAGLAETV
jgi:hypothetical protein